MLKLHEIPDLFTDLATIYEAPAYQLQFIGAGRRYKPAKSYSTRRT